MRARFLNALGRIKTQFVRIRTRLLVINLVIVMVPVLGIEWAQSFERESLKALEQDMLHHAQIIRTVLEQNLDRSRRPRFAIAGRALEQMAKRTRMRIRLLNRRGGLLADSHRKGAPEGPEPAVPQLFGSSERPQRLHPADEPSTDPGPISRRPEILDARRGQLGTSTRVHKRIQRVFLFVAMPVMVDRRVQGVVYVTRSTVPVLQSLYRLRTHLYQVLAVALGLTVLMTIFLAWTISRPLTRLTRAARRIAGGDRSASLHLQRSDEIGQLARTFETMVQKLDARARYISEFAANISHEFKTPLASIRGAAELLVDGADEDPGARRRFLENILADSRRLDRLVTRILELSRIEATLEHREALDFAELALEVADRFPEHPVEVELGDDVLPFRGNRAHLESALTALVENAVYYSPSQREVKLWAKIDERGTLMVVVEDHGKGISEANQAKIFQRFFTTESASGGTGLGLATVATVVQAHGGTVTVSSTLGQGSRFELLLPGAIQH